MIFPKKHKHKHSQRLGSVAASVAQAYAESQVEVGRFNLGVFGKTGVGKSTLINAIYGAQVAQTGTGAPVTRGMVRYLHPNGVLALYDSEGFEVGAASEDTLAWLRAQVRASRDGHDEEQLHAVWYCVRWSDRRLEQAQQEFIREFSQLGLPVIVVLTQVPVRQDAQGQAQIHPDALEFGEYIAQLGLPIVANGICYTNALPDEFLGTPAYGLTQLLDLTYAISPEAKHAALTAAQTIDLDRKAKAARKATALAAGVAGATGATPIPFADAAVLVPLQLGLMARIALIYGIPMDKAAMAAAAATATTTQAGRFVVSNLLKFVPGAGSVAGGVISAGTASAITYALGESWREICHRILLGKVSVRDTKTLARLLTSGMKKFGRELPPGEGGAAKP